MEDARRDILIEVAAGSLSPEEGAAQIEELERNQPLAVDGATGPVKQVRIEAQARSVLVIGDSAVSVAVAEGRHQARHEGETLVIEDGESVSDFGFRFGRHDFHWGGWGLMEEQPLVVRMNPSLPLEVELQAGSIRTRGVRAYIKADIQAGSARIEDFAGPIDLHVQAGSVRASGSLQEGESRVRCEAGSVRLELDAASNVRVRARSSLGKVDLPGGASEWVAGAGAGNLLIEVGMGKVQVSQR